MVGIELIGGILFMGAGGFLFWKGLQTMSNVRLIQNLPTSKARSVAMGIVELKGKAEPAELTLQSPFSKKDCIYYRSLVEEYVQSNKSGHWRTLQYLMDVVPFYVKDNTGKVLVNPLKADWNIQKDQYHQSGLFKEIPPHLISYLEEQGLRTKTLFGFNKKLRFQEWYVEPNDELYVLGTADRNPHIENPQENTDNIIIKKGKTNPIFIISDKPEKEVTKIFRWKILGFLVSGGILLLFGLGMLLVILKIFEVIL